jgi:hypothetical protein
MVLQRAVRERLRGRAFGLVSSMDSWAICAAVVMGGAFVALIGARGTFTLAGLGLAALGLGLAASRARVVVPQTA